MAHGRRAILAAVLGLCLGASGGSTPEPPLVPATAGQVLEAVRRPGARAVLLNVWATWCVPCVEEFPDLVRLQREYGPRGLRLVLVSMDFGLEREERVREFLKRHGVDFESYLKAGDDMEFIDQLEPRWSGALPATLLYDGRGVLRELWEGERPPAFLRGKAREALGLEPVPAGSPSAG